MKTKQKANIIILVLGLIFAVSTISNYNFSDDQGNSDGSNGEIRDDMSLERPRKSGTYTESFIHIDGSIPNNWTWTAGNYSWCYGNGSLGNPYVIENVTIDASSSPTGNGILINNSKNDYFIIRNCNVTNAGSMIYDAGIKLENTNNGTLANNNCSINNWIGIFLFNNCDDNNILGNIANENIEYGIFLSKNCDDNTILGNIANDNDEYGIYLVKNCDDNTISGNTASNVGTMNQLVGIYLIECCDENTISGNTIYDNINFGIYLAEDSNENTISGNTAYDNSIGIYIYFWCDDNTITENIVYENDLGILLSDNYIYNLLFYNCIFNNSASNGEDSGSSTDWDNGTIGNYWGDYSGTDADYDGIGDTPYDISGGNNKDDKPLMNYNPCFFKPPEDLTYEEGTEGHNLIWIVFTTTPGRELAFSVSRDGTTIKVGKLSSFFNEIVINVDGLDLGAYIFSLVVQDNEWGFRSDGVIVTVTSATLEPSPVINTYYITEEDGDKDDHDDDELVSSSIITASIIIAVTGGVIATAIILHALLMKKRIVPETPTPSNKKQPIK